MEGEEQVKQPPAQEPQPARGRAPGYQPLLGGQVGHPAPIQRWQAQECFGLGEIGIAEMTRGTLFGTS